MCYIFTAITYKLTTDTSAYPLCINDTSLIALSSNRKT